MTAIKTLTTTASIGIILKAAPEDQRSLAAMLPTAAISYQFSRSGVTDRAQLLSLLPVERVPAVLLQDGRVFPEAKVEKMTISEEEATRLAAAGLERYLGRSEVMSEQGLSMIVSSLMTFTHYVDDMEALTHLDSILNSGNEREWKEGCLQAMPEHFWALALKAQDDDYDAVDDTLQAIDEILPDMAASLRELGARFHQSELMLRVLEDREEGLSEMTKDPQMVLTEEAGAALETLKVGRTAKNLLADMRRSGKE